MRANYRRQRRPDPLASPAAVRAVMERLRSALPEIIPRRENDLVRMLRAVRHVNRYPATDTKRGRPGRWKREELLAAGARLSSLLERETSSHISLSSFVDHYLRLLEFPSDVVEALSSGQINLFEASQLARLNPERLRTSPPQAKRTRQELLLAHLQARLSGESLRRRVAEILRVSSDSVDDVNCDNSGSDPESFDPYDPTHLFWDQITQLELALRSIRREDIRDEEIEELLEASEPVMAILSRILRRKERKVVKLQL